MHVLHSALRSEGWEYTSLNVVEQVPASPDLCPPSLVHAFKENAGYMLDFLKLKLWNENASLKIKNI